SWLFSVAIWWPLIAALWHPPTARADPGRCLAEGRGRYGRSDPFVQLRQGKAYGRHLHQLDFSLFQRPVNRGVDAVAIFELFETRNPGAHADHDAAIGKILNADLWRLRCFIGNDFSNRVLYEGADARRVFIGGNAEVTLDDAHFHRVDDDLTAYFLVRNGNLFAILAGK